MGVRNNESMGFVDAMMAELSGPRAGTLLDKLDVALRGRSWPSRS